MKKMQTMVKDIIKWGMTPSNIARDVGVNRATVGKWRDGTFATVYQSNLDAIKTLHARMKARETRRKQKR